MNKSEDPTSPDRLLTVNELAEYFHVHPGTIYAWERKGEIPSFRRGRTIRFSLADVLEAMEPSTDEFAQSAASRRAWRRDGDWYYRRAT